MQKLRATIIAITLGIMFFIPMTVMGEYEYAIEEKPVVLEEPAPEKPKEEPIFEEMPEGIPEEEYFRIFDIETEEIKNIAQRIHIAINTQNVLNLKLNKKNFSQNEDLKHEDIVCDEKEMLLV